MRVEIGYTPLTLLFEKRIRLEEASSFALPRTRRMRLGQPHAATDAAVE
jgi:hypothetical protein